MLSEWREEVRPSTETAGRQEAKPQICDRTLTDSFTFAFFQQMCTEKLPLVAVGSPEVTVVGGGRQMSQPQGPPGHAAKHRDQELRCWVQILPLPIPH